MTRDVDAIRADLAARTVGGMASSAADRDIAALLGVIDRLRAKDARLEALFADGPDPLCRTTWVEGAWGRVECVEVPMDDLRAAFEGTP